ncbi:hypothetical protein JKF63_05502 [Porcisia hertigi]|uniref:SAM-dependent MTase RsmB/NOP-type domain-containing protein n=1 Tax=Porcisia hertigi TaxID=2761500 RepID=A0A836IBJ1_9TRYP|nr:hypothetical protein JKF63_05502 [Porcisia hertigi]
MVRATRRVLFDSFRAARGELDHIFSSTKSEHHIRNAVRQYVIPSLSRQRHRSVEERLGRSQERSLFRTNASLLLQEARRRGNHRVAAAALDIVLTEIQWLPSTQLLEPTWIKDAVSSCQSAEELRVIEGVLQRHEQRLLASGSVVSSEGFLLAAAFGRSRATERAVRLGDDDGALEDSLQSVGHAPTTTTSLHATSDSLVRSGAAEGGSGGVGVTLSKQARVSAALAQPPSLTDLATTGGSASEALWSSSEERAAAALRRLQHQQRNLTAGPNVSFTRYFLHQGLVRDEAELIELYRAMRSRPLDVGFRVVGGGGDAASGTSQPHRLCSPHTIAVHALLQRRRGLHRVPWLPPAMGAYTLDTRDSTPADTLLANRQLLRSLSRERLIVFQSLSSMLPIYCLDPQPGECVLDMCASPGNKTELILDCMHAGDCKGTSLSSTSVPRAGAATSDRGIDSLLGSGCVVANEAQASRIGALQERLRDASPEVVVTRGRGETFGQAGPSEGGGNNGVGGRGGFLGEGMYDRVLVDAPCSGEGRMGRDSLSWRLWHPGRGIEFFPLQCALLHQAVRLCKVGGRIVYATCTLNPLENEAVVAAVLRACGKTVELVPPPRLLPHRSDGQTEESSGGSLPPLRLTAGLRSWDVPSSAGGFLRSVADAHAQGESSTRLLPDMFAPGSVDAGDSDISEALHRCCRRVMPHLNSNTDGFFVAVLEKQAEVPERLDASQAQAVTAGSLRLGSSLSGAVGGNGTAAASLAVSLAGGSNIFNDRGFVRLPPSHHLVLKHLGGFFAAAPSRHASASTNASALMTQQPRESECNSAQDFLQKQGWAAVWCEREGLRLLTQSSVQLLRRHPAVPVTSPKSRPNSFGLGFARRPDEAPAVSAGPPAMGTELLNAGVLVVTAQGALTERGAALIRPSARSRVVSLPLPFAQLLLANRTLDIGAALHLMPDYIQEAERALGPQRGFLTTSLGTAPGGDGPTAKGAHTSTWYSEALMALSSTLGKEVGVAGNAIVVVSLLSSGPSTSPSWATPLAHWAWPVHVEVLQPWSPHDIGEVPRGLVRLHLTLPEASRHRTRALIGRLQGCAHLQRSTRDRLHTASAHDPSLTMTQRDLHGTTMRANQRNRLLLRPGVPTAASPQQPPPVPSARSPKTVTTEVASPSNVFEL